MKTLNTYCRVIRHKFITHNKQVAKYKIYLLDHLSSSDLIHTYLHPYIDFTYMMAIHVRQFILTTYSHIFEFICGVNFSCYWS